MLLLSLAGAVQETPSIALFTEEKHRLHSPRGDRRMDKIRAISCQARSLWVNADRAIAALASFIF